ncbi:hypothetical protein OESDEN_18139 [Oesophagostomum dentatum]|uniref:Uncharacterized protein n=1 Tax=Oesophagostomum dentatum TaxID=61180 RepID=A0A0B1SBA0_OESDE|nr:hypothetical protein OESDEN_18139 [Oesophagostomum dentatum]
MQKLQFMKNLGQGLFVVKSLEAQCDRDSLTGNAENGGEIIAVTKIHISRNGCVGRKDDKTQGCCSKTFSSSSTGTKLWWWWKCYTD